MSAAAGPRHTLPSQRYPGATFVYAFYVSNWNSHIVVAATGAELVWLDGQA